MTTVSRRTLVRAAAVTVCAGALLTAPTAAALAEGLPAASAGARTLVSNLSLADGRSTALVYRLPGDMYEADVLRDGARVASLTSRPGAPATGQTQGLHIALRADGRLSSWVGAIAPGPGGHALAGDGHKTATRGRPVSAAVAPRSAAVEALRSYAVPDGPGNGALLLAAGGGIAAVGAAGLGFAMLRRGRTDA
ncbi:hypothetical protein ABZ934_07115 [Streptomyces sp. NPDC046557]|uniref:hypothetical protein n=1 Tax=Streptomyces sp. NPDC046557 TaxID=3155372 RepID=UPI0033F80DB9